MEISSRKIPIFKNYFEKKKNGGQPDEREGKGGVPGGWHPKLVPVAANRCCRRTVAGNSTKERAREGYQVDGTLNPFLLQRAGAAGGQWRATQRKRGQGRGTR
jgi:hypothetical protein